MRRIVGMISLVLVLLLPALAASQQKGDTVAAPASARTRVCDEGNSQLATVNPEYVWRLRAYEDLDCALVILDEALQGPGTSITLPRHEAERVRARLWSARDAAGRIGR